MGVFVLKSCCPNLAKKSKKSVCFSARFCSKGAWSWLSFFTYYYLLINNRYPRSKLHKKFSKWFYQYSFCEWFQANLSREVALKMNNLISFSFGYLKHCYSGPPTWNNKFGSKKEQKLVGCNLKERKKPFKGLQKWCIFVLLFCQNIEISIFVPVKPKSSI